MDRFEICVIFRKMSTGAILLSVKYSGETTMAKPYRETTVAKPYMLDSSVIFPICCNRLPVTTKQFIGACLLMKQQHPLTLNHQAYA